MNVIFLGPPGSGKGTMAQRVAKRCGLCHISTGDMLREEIKRGTALGKSAQDYISRGALVPDDVIVDMIQERFREDDAKGGVILDGFPRTEKQAVALDFIVDIDLVINLVVDVDVIVDRVLSRRVCSSCGAVYSTKTTTGNTCELCHHELIQRPDDNEETVRERFRVYEEQTEPLIRFYNQKGIVRDVDATLPIDEEADIICTIIKDTKNK